MLNVSLGKWYKNNVGQIVRVIALEEITSFDSTTIDRKYVVKHKTGDSYKVNGDGEYINPFGHVICGTDYKLVEHLPKCTGYEWKEEKWISWTFETMPLGVKTKINDKNDPNVRLARPNCDFYCCLGTSSLITYKVLFETRVQLDGTPCGTQLFSVEDFERKLQITSERRLGNYVG